MAEPFKHLINEALVRDTGRHLQSAMPAFDRDGFEQDALHGLDALELKARAQQVCTALEGRLPHRFDEAAQVMEAALAPVVDPSAEGFSLRSDEGVCGWAVWPLTLYVARHGLHDAARALRALHAMTQRFTAEWALRPFLLRHPSLVYPTLQAWTADPSPHVRRLVSEGSRPRLPWGEVLQPLVADPSPTLPLLSALQDDTSAYVRRSVANHLNDIAKDHPDVVHAWLLRHLPQAPAPRRALLKHASRTLIKRADPNVLAAWGLGQPLQGHAAFGVTPCVMQLGESLTLQVDLRSTSARAQPLVIDVAVHFVKARGETSPKVFKGWQTVLQAGEQRTLLKNLPLKPVTTRRHFAGHHAIDLVVNGLAVARAGFELQVPAGEPRTNPR